METINRNPPAKVIATKLANGHIVVGFDSGDRDCVGTVDEVAWLHDVVVFDGYGATSEYPRCAVLTSGELDSDADYEKAEYAVRKLREAEETLNEALAAVAAAKADYAKFEALYNAMGPNEASV